MNWHIPVIFFLLAALASGNQMVFDKANNSICIEANTNSTLLVGLPFDKDRVLAPETGIYIIPAGAKGCVPLPKGESLSDLRAILTPSDFTPLKGLVHFVGNLMYQGNTSDSDIILNFQ